jgi:5'-nucleotidase
MKRKIIVGALTLAAIAGGGCQSNGSKQSTASSKAPLRPAVTDIAPTPPAAYIAPVQQPIQPVVVAAAAAPDPVAATAAPVTAAPATGKGSYTVQKGDTLYKIARERYGDGKQWQKIASANPGLSPGTLKAGQRIIIP